MPFIMVYFLLVHVVCLGPAPSVGGSVGALSVAAILEPDVTTPQKYGIVTPDLHL